jgi:hypothetical protein
MLSRLLASMIVASALTACAAPPDQAVPAPSRTLILERSLVGRTIGQGAFVNGITGSETKFDVVIDGTWDGKVLTLKENFTYGDGSRDRKTWHLTKIGDGRYRGTREDVVGFAEVKQDGQGVRLDYYVTLPTAAGGIDVRFRDLLYLREDGTIANEAVVSKLGVRIGRVAITMRPMIASVS